jgi:hypothetical protein
MDSFEGVFLFIYESADLMNIATMIRNTIMQIVAAKAKFDATETMVPSRILIRFMA